MGQNAVFGCNGLCVAGSVKPFSQRGSMMRKTHVRFTVLRQTLLLVLGIALVAFPAGPAAAGPAGVGTLLQKSGVTLKKDFGAQVMLDQTLFNVNIPLNISNMPGPWKNAKLKAVAFVYFLDGPGEMIGYGISEGGEEYTPLNITLDNGNYNGTVALPIRKTAGALSGKTCSVAMVIAELGNQTMFIGASKGGTAPNSGHCAKMASPPIQPGTILP